MKSRLMSAKILARQNDIFDLVWPFLILILVKGKRKPILIAKFLFSKTFPAQTSF
jgi:hypothetical protein